MEAFQSLMRWNCVWSLGTLLSSAAKPSLPPAWVLHPGLTKQSLLGLKPDFLPIPDPTPASPGPACCGKRERELASRASLPPASIPSSLLHLVPSGPSGTGVQFPSTRRHPPALSTLPCCARQEVWFPCDQGSRWPR